MAEPTPTDVDTNSGTGSGMIAFINWAAKKHEIVENTATTLRTAAKRVLETDESLSDEDVRIMDLEEITRRFRNKQRGGEFKDASIEVYIRRFKQAVEIYKKWLDNDPSWRPQQSRTSPRSADKADTGGKKKPTRPNTSVSAQATVAAAPTVIGVSGSGHSAVQMITYPYPVRLGMMAQIILPADLTSKEAERVAKFVASLAFDERLAITAGPAAQ